MHRNIDPAASGERALTRNLYPELVRRTVVPRALIEPARAGQARKSTEAPVSMISRRTPLISFASIVLRVRAGNRRDEDFGPRAPVDKVISIASRVGRSEQRGRAQ